MFNSLRESTFSSFDRERTSLRQQRELSNSEIICSEQYNVIHCIETAHYYHFPRDCVFWIFTFLPKCYFCHRTTIEGATFSDPCHNLCYDMVHKPYKCLICKKPCEKTSGMIHFICKESHRKSYSKRYALLKDLDVRFEKGPYEKTLKCQGLLLRNIRSHGVPVNFTICRPIGLSVLTEVNGVGKDRLNKNDVDIPSLEETEERKYIISYSTSIDEGGGSANETILYEPFEVKLKIIRTFIFLFIKRKIFLFREDQLCAILRFLYERISLPDLRNFQWNEKIKKVSVLDSKFTLPIKYLDPKFRHLFEEKEKYKIVREIVFSKIGFLKHFFIVHGLHGEMNKVHKDCFGDLAFMTEYIPIREKGISRFNKCFYIDNSIMKVNETLHESLRMSKQQWFSFRPGRNIRCLLRPRNCFFSRTRNVYKKFDSAFRELGKNWHINVILNLAMVDCLFGETNKYSMILKEGPDYISDGRQSMKFNDNDGKVEVKVIINFDGMYFEWDEESEILIPKKSTSYLIPLHRCHFLSFVMREPDDYLGSHLRAHRIIERYNHQYRFSSKNYEERNFANNERGAFDFVEEFVSCMVHSHTDRFEKMLKMRTKMRFPFNRNVSFFKTLRDKGKSTLKFSMSIEFRETFKLSTKVTELEFETHEELDEFILGLNQVTLSWIDDFRVEYNILRAFDAVFWSRHQMFPKNKKYQPIEGQYSPIQSDCPFFDPRTIHGFNENYF